MFTSVIIVGHLLREIWKTVMEMKMSCKKIFLSTFSIFIHLPLWLTKLHMRLNFKHLYFVFQLTIKILTYLLTDRKKT